MSSLLDGINFPQIDAATTEQKKALLRLAADDLRINQSSPRFHTAYRQVIDEGQSAKEALSDMVKFEDRARQEWVERSLQPWCDRHGLTLKQGLSVLFDDHPYNPEDPSKDIVTKESVFGWGGQQNDFAYRLMDDMKQAVAKSADIASTAHAQAAVFNKCAASIEEGILTLEAGTTIDLLKVQAACNYAFQETGDQEFATAVDEMAKATGVFQGPHGEWIDGAAGDVVPNAPVRTSDEMGFEIHGVQRWDVMEGSEDAVPGEPTYTVKVRAHSGQIAIEILSPETAAAVAEVQAGTVVNDSDPRWALPCLEVTLEVNEGLPCVHVHGGVSGDLAQTVFALPDAKVAIRAVDDPGMKDAVIFVPDTYMPDFEEAHALFAAVRGVDLAVPADPEAPQ